MIRSAFNPRQSAPRQDRSSEFATWVPRPREIAVAVVGPARATVAVPKFVYVRDKRLRTMCQGMSCLNCGHVGGVTWAHSNQAIHGKGRGIKASDLYISALCIACHSWLDHGRDGTQAEKVAMWTNAHQATVLVALHSGIWPAGITPPDITGKRTGDRS